MKITDITTYVVNLDFRNCIFVKVSTDSGITGVAETVMKRRTFTIEQSILQLKRFLIGRDPTEIEDLWEKMYRDSFWVGGTMHATAISVIDCALWEILAKSCAVPVYKLHGGPTRKQVLAYCHCPGGRDPDDLARNVKACMQRGYRAVKMTLPLFYGSSDCNGGGYSGTDGFIDRSWKETEYINPAIFDRIREFFLAAREAGGSELGIAVDCHGRLNLKAALRLCRVLDDLNLMFIEEPVPPENSDVLAILNKETSIPIAAGERWATLHGVREFVEKQAVDILQCDVVNCGGISGLKKIAALAEAHYITMAPHNPNGPLATQINIQFAAMIPNFYILETIGSDAEQKLWQELIGKPLLLDRGHLAVNCEPGFGVTLNEDVFANLPYTPCEAGR